MISIARQNKSGKGLRVAQSATEYTLLAAIVCAVAVAMGFYVRNARSGDVRKQAAMFGAEYSPQSSNYTKLTTVFPSVTNSKVGTQELELNGKTVNVTTHSVMMTDQVVRTGGGTMTAERTPVSTDGAVVAGYDLSDKLTALFDGGVVSAGTGTDTGESVEDYGGLSLQNDTLKKQLQ